MALKNVAQPNAGSRALSAAVEHIGLIWRDPGFQMVLRREAKRFALNVASEVRAASVRNRG